MDQERRIEDRGADKEGIGEDDEESEEDEKSASFLDKLRRQSLGKPSKSFLKS